MLILLYKLHFSYKLREKKNSFEFGIHDSCKSILLYDVERYIKRTTMSMETEKIMDSDCPLIALAFSVAIGTVDASSTTRTV